MFSALVGLAIGLQTIPERLQCPADHKGRKRVANSSESFSHMLQAVDIHNNGLIGSPRVAESTTFFRSSMRAGYWIVFFASAADPTNPRPVGRRIGFQFGNPAIDRAPRDTRRLLDYIGPSKAVGAHLSRPRKVAVLVRREPTTYPSIAFGWPGLRRMGEFTPGF